MPEMETVSYCKYNLISFNPWVDLNLSWSSSLECSTQKTGQFLNNTLTFSLCYVLVSS